MAAPLTDLTAGGEDEEEGGTPAAAAARFSLPCAISLVFITSNGPVATGPTTPATKPDIIDCQGARILPSPSFFLHTTVSIANLVENMHAWFVPFRRTVGATPAHRPRKPSSNHIVPENGAKIKQAVIDLELHARGEIPLVLFPIRLALTSSMKRAMVAQVTNVCPSLLLQPDLDNLKRCDDQDSFAHTCPEP